jgi:hypothetical protein
MFKHIIKNIILLEMDGPYISVHLEFVSKTIMNSGQISAKDSRWICFRPPVSPNQEAMLNAYI